MTLYLMQMDENAFDFFMTKKKGLKGLNL